ncbi:SIMPL domain-containing protein [Daejeonella sp.]|uniref:SIMPL domain-containing protein n=1 Tax=Daejeonella sp. TaxID=2805397 RepID=UPI0030BB1506
MKKIIAMLLAGTVVLASSCSEKSTKERIEVIGSAETEVTPDIVYVGISLREYFVTGTKQRVSIEILEQKLQASIKAAGIDSKNLLINNVASYQEYYKRSRDPQFMAGKQYRLKLPDVKKLDAILSSMDPQGIQYTQIEGYDYSNLDTIKKNLKIKALKAARDKALYLTGSIDKKLGEAIEISEIVEPENMNRRMDAGNGSLYETVEQSAATSNVDFKTVKLSSKMRAVFRME